MQLNFILAAIVSLSLPGLALAILIGIKRNLVLNSIALSYSVFFVVFILLLFTDNLANYLLPLYTLILIASFCLVAFYLVKNSHLLATTKDFFFPALILIAVFIYTYFAGAYTEIPADLYSHLERYQFALSQLSNNDQSHQINLLKQSYGWYFFLALLTKIAPISTSGLVESVSFVTNSVFLICIYFFCNVLFRENHQSKLISVTACAFVALHMGINVFAFIRYYALAPTMLGFCLYFAALATLINAIQNRVDYSIFGWLFLIVLFTLCGFSNHAQEAMFIVVMSCLIIGVYSCSILGQKVLAKNKTKFGDRFWLVCLLLAVIAFICIYIYAHTHLNRAPNAQGRLWEFGQGFGLIPDITTLNLKFQFIRVVTLWGCLVYLLFFLNWRRYKYNLFIVAGMVSPLFTILNPFFVDFFLRIANSTTLWRLVYIIPIHFVAADLFVLNLQKLKEQKRFRKIFPLLIITLLIGLLMPINNTWQKAHYSRMVSLKPTEDQSSLYYYADVLEFLNNINEKNTIVTDPITGYVIASMTHHSSPRRKFFRSALYRPFSFQEYDQDTLSEYKGYLLLVNQRQQPLSETGRLSGQWSRTELQNISFYYPEPLIAHLNDNGQLFENIWSQNGISIYRIK